MLLTAETPPIIKSTVEKKTCSEREKEEENRVRTGKILGGLDLLDVLGVRHGF